MKEEHCDRNSLLSVDTDDVAAHGAQSAQDGPQRLNNQQKQKVVGKNLNLVLLTTLVLCVDSLTSRERGRKVGTGTMPSSPRTSLVLGPRNAPKAPWAAPSSVSTDTMKVRSQRSSLLAVDG